MKNVSLIKKIEYPGKHPEAYPVTFDIGYDFDRETLKHIFNEIKDKSLLAGDGINLGKNSFTVQILLKNIPKITTILTAQGQIFYGIYVLYDNFLEMKEVENE